MIRSLVFHIGDPKCASSSIQATLASRAWHCDDVSIEPQKETNAVEFATAVSKPTRQRRFNAQVQAKLDWVTNHDADVGVISAEHLWKTKPEFLSYVASLINPGAVHPPRVIAYIRPHHAVVVSGFSEAVKLDTTGSSLFAYGQEVLEGDRCRYWPRFSAWNAEFPSRFALRLLRPESLVGGDALVDFFSWVTEGANVSVTSNQAVNRSMFVDELSALRFLHRRLSAYEIPRTFRAVIGQEISRHIERETSAETPRSGIKLSLGRDLATLIHSACRQDAIDTGATFFDSNILVTELDESTESARGESTVLRAADYYSAETLNSIDELASVVSLMDESFLTVWKRKTLESRGRILRSTSTTPPPHYDSNVETMNETIREIAAIFTNCSQANSSISPTISPVEVEAVENIDDHVA